MRIENFTKQIEQMGFVDTGDRVPQDDWLRTCRAPERLATALEWLNLGGTVGKKHEYHVTFQPPENGLVDKLGLPVSVDTVVHDGVEHFFEHRHRELPSIGV